MAAGRPRQRHLPGRLALVLPTAAALLGALLVAPSPMASAVQTSCGDLENVAHRGYHGPGYDENSMRGFAEAVARGYEIETDVRADAEGQLWIFHDRNAYRATGVDANIDEMTTAQVAALRYRKAKSALPRFEEAVAAWQTYKSTTIYLEPKSQAIATRAAAIVKAAGLADRVYFTAYPSYLNSTSPGLLLQGKYFDSVPDPQKLAAGGITSAQFGVEQLTADIVDRYRAAGVDVHTKTTNSTTQWRSAILKGFDGIMNDFPDDLKAYCPTV